MDKKNIDELFRSTFKTFREVPDEKVWAKIENSLDKKRKKRVVPFWWPLGGVAALLAIGFFAFYTVNNSGDESRVITDTENSKGAENKEDVLDSGIRENQKDALQIPETTEDAVVDGSDGSSFKNTEEYPVSSSEKSNVGNASGTTELNNKEDILKTGEVNDEAVANNRKDIQQKNTKGYDRAGEDSETEAGTAIPNRDRANVPNTGNVNGTEVAASNAETSKQVDTSKSGTWRKSQDGLAANQDDPDTISEKSKIAIAQSDQNEKEGISKETSADGDRKSNFKTSGEAIALPNGNKKSNFKTSDENIGRPHGNNESNFKTSDTAIALNDGIEKGAIGNDTIADANKKSIFEALEAQNEEEIVEGSGSRWSAGPNIAPVYFDATGEGSPIDPGFSTNARSGSTNISFGVSVAYAVTKKLSVRSGIHKADYGYDTNDVGFSQTLAASTSGRLQNVDLNRGVSNAAVSSPVADQESLGNSSTPEFKGLNASRDGEVAQRFGYLEIPLELDYALIDRRFGVKVVGGVSSLFLTNNSVTLNSGELTTEIGEANNLNSVNFSTNVGFGINYKFTPKVQLNIEPVFKYQLNTFSNVSGDFRPFSIGVYSGLNFKF